MANDLWREVAGSIQRDIVVAARPTAAARPPPAQAHEPFVLGVNIEELYCLFGEQFLTLFGGTLPDAMMEVYERKWAAVRDTLLEREIDDKIVALVWELQVQVARGRGWGDSPDGLAGLSQMAHQVAGYLGQIMGVIRKLLGESAGPSYDLGVFAARLGVCCRAIAGAAGLGGAEGASWRATYAEELGRAAGHFVRLHGEASGAGLLAGFEPRVRVALADTVRRAVELGAAPTDPRVAALNDQLEQLLAAVGLQPGAA